MFVTVRNYAEEDTHTYGETEPNQYRGHPSIHLHTSQSIARYAANTVVSLPQWAMPSVCLSSAAQDTVGIRTTRTSLRKHFSVWTEIERRDRLLTTEGWREGGQCSSIASSGCRLITQR
mmetsp:Transcript_28280/g.81477  ORF Transcript_28280/g.81477 Transcript_28280/m.81477 type:complete len:119 (-) Transcript_28280:134-490(-)